MEKGEKPAKVYFVLAALTLAFLAALAFLALRGEGVEPGAPYQVSAERSVPAAEVVPEKEPVDINTATASELEDLIGIGPTLAQAIVDYRDRHGPFSSVEELLEVSGIGEGKLDGIRDDITVGEEENG